MKLRIKELMNTLSSSITIGKELGPFIRPFISGIFTAILSVCAIWCSETKYFILVLLFAIIFFCLTVCLIVVVRRKNSVISEQNARIVHLEEDNNMPYFKDWYLVYTYMWRKKRDWLHNKIIIDELIISRKLHGIGDLKNNSATYTFKGTYQGSSDYFSFCIAGLLEGSTKFKDINFTAFDAITREPLYVILSPDTFDGNMKYIQIFFRQTKVPGDYIEIILSWDWPRTTHAKSDYFVVPNVYGIETKKIVTEFVPTSDMHITSVEAYIYNEDCAKLKKPPQLIADIYADCNNHYNYTFDNLEQNADYIISFE